MKKLIGNHVYLRPVLEEDYPCFVSFLNDFEGAIYINALSNIYNLDDEREYFKPTENKRVLGVVDKETDALLGLVEIMNIDWVHRYGELGIFIGEPSGRNRGVGYDTIMLMLDYGFDVLNLEAIHLTVSEFNHRGRALYKKCGFKEAGKLRNHIRFMGKTYDRYYMDILREEHRPYRCRKELENIIEKKKHCES